MTDDDKVNQFAIRCFRNTADGDYITARMAHRAQLESQFLWSSQQAIEKYLKCILVLHRENAKTEHDVKLALDRVNSRVICLPLSQPSLEFIEHINEYGPDRYLTVSFHTLHANIVLLDRCVWEIRRYCLPCGKPELSEIAADHKEAVHESGRIPDKILIPGGTLEKIITDAKHPAREPLLWQNGFFGKKHRRVIRPRIRLKAVNAPLYLHPEIAEEISKFVKLPKGIVDACRSLEQQRQRGAGTHSPPGQ